MDSITQQISESLNEVMQAKCSKLEYVASASGVAIETVRRVRNGQVSRLRMDTAQKLAHFLEAETEGAITAIDLLEKQMSDNAFYRLLIEKNRDGIYVIQDNRIVFSNTRVQEMTGYSAEELQAEHYTRFLDAESEVFEHKRAEKLRKGESAPDQFPVKVVCKDGRILQAETHISRFVHNGNKGALGTLREVTKQNMPQL